MSYTMVGNECMYDFINIVNDSKTE